MFMRYALQALQNYFKNIMNLMFKVINFWYMMCYSLCEQKVCIAHLIKIYEKIDQILLYEFIQESVSRRR